jgi:hypothetical protein
VPVRAYPTYEKIEHTSKMIFITVVLNTKSQVAVKCKRVNEVLQMVAVLKHAALERLGPVVCHPITKMV